MGMIRKALRNKDVRVNGNKIKDDEVDGLLAEITKIVKKHEPDVEVIEK